MLIKKDKENKRSFGKSKKICELKIFKKNGVELKLFEKNEF